MCATCGCSGSSGDPAHDAGGAPPTHPHSHEHGAHSHPHEHAHSHDHEHDAFHAHSHEHEHDHVLHEHGPSGEVVRLERELLEKNDRVARSNRAWLKEQRIFALNFTSSPGSGKTTLLERTIRELGRRVPVSVIEGDQATARDAERIRSTGAPVVQINTGAGCHLDARMVAKALSTLRPPSRSLLLVENVGNLVCPALFDLGERAKVVVLSVTEGEDKPLKYPHMFRAAEVLVVNKTDLSPYVDCDAEVLVDNARRVNPRLRVFSVSAKRGDGIGAWCDWLRASVEGAPEQT